MIANFLNLFKVPEIRKRILITLGFLVVYRIGWNIPIPGIDLGVLRDAAQRNTEGGGNFAQLFSLISGGGLYSCALFSLGIMPYISASIIFSLLTKVVPSLEAVAKEGAAGQRKINQWTRLATLPLCFVQALILVANVFKVPMQGGAQPFLPDGFWLAANAVLALTAGGILLMWIGEQITEYGVGNGISLLIMAGIIARVPDAMVGLIEKNEGGFLPFALLLLFLVVVLVVVYITKGMRKIPVQYAKLTRGRKVYGGQRHFMPIKVNQAGVMPVIFSSALLSFPNLLGQAFGWEGFSRAFTPGQWWYTVSDIALIFFFSFFWNSLMFNPVEMSKNMKESGAFIPGIRPGKKTAEFLQKVMTRITLAGASFLAVIASVPQQLASLISEEVPMEVRYFLGGTSILIVVSVALDLVDKLNSALLMRNYGGFMESGGSGRRKRREGGSRRDRKRGSKEA